MEPTGASTCLPVPLCRDLRESISAEVSLRALAAGFDARLREEWFELFVGMGANRDVDPALGSFRDRKRLHTWHPLRQDIAQ